MKRYDASKDDEEEDDPFNLPSPEDNNDGKENGASYPEYAGVVETDKEAPPGTNPINN
ncbi:MAG: hypothetical protein ACJ788_15440 [Ktedonobacteraceae bacterium]